MAKKKTEKLKTEKKQILKPQWEQFCRLYTLVEGFFGNATLSYGEAFGYDLQTLDRKAKYSDVPDDENDEDSEDHREMIEESPYKKAFNTCSVNGNRLLRNDKIRERCAELLNFWMKDVNVDAELAKVIKQQDDLPSKVAGIREFNKLKGRITDKLKISGGLSLTDLLNETDGEGK